MGVQSQQTKRFKRHRTVDKAYTKASEFPVGRVIPPLEQPVDLSLLNMEDEEEALRWIDAVSVFDETWV